MDGSQSEMAYLAIEQLIITLELKPGALVTERQLIELAGHGRTPVREAIQKLAWQGLISIRPRVGLQITDIHSGAYAEIMAVRARLEPLAAALAAVNATPEQRLAIIDCAKAMTNSAIDGDIVAFLAADKLFDVVLEQACPNRFLSAALAPLQTHSRRMWFSQASIEKLDRSVSLHVSVIRAIQKGDAEDAERAMVALLGYLAG
ncbi:MAG: GntR family transcriptional regulator [Allorhizobium sp.]